MRRILLFLIIFILIGGGVWYFFIRPKTGSSTNPITTAFQSFFPNSNSGTPPEGIIPNGTGSTTTAGEERFTQITSRPIAGYSLFALSYTKSTPNADPKLPNIITTVTDHFVRYVSRSNGYVFEIKNTDPAIQITNIVIPNIYEAEFVSNNTIALLRFLKSNSQTIATYSVPIPPLNADGTRTQNAGVYLNDNITSLATSPDSKFIARLTEDANGGLISTTTATNTVKKDIFRSSFKEWLLFWPTQSSLYVQTKAASSANGFLYKVDSAAGKLRRIVGDVPGLTTSISPDGTYVLYSESIQDSFVTKLFNTKTGATTPINISILPEKCVWYANNNLLCAGSNNVPEGVYPDSWYAGLTHFQDGLYYVDTATNTYSVVYNGNDRTFDMTHLKLDEGQNLLYFIDKPTGILWKITL